MLVFVTLWLSSSMHAVTSVSVRRVQVAEEVAHSGRRMEGELCDLNECLGVLKTRAGPKRRRLELFSLEEINKERN